MLGGFIGFIIVHVTLVGLTGFARNMNHIVLGIDDLRPAGMILGLIGIAVVVLSWVVAHYVSWVLSAQIAARTESRHPTGETSNARPPPARASITAKTDFPALLA